MKKIYYLMAMAMMAFTFTSCEDVPEPFGQPINPNQSEETIDPAGDGTAASPYNVAAAIAKCKEVGEAGSSEKYYIKGIVVEGGEIPTGDTYGNITFKIADTPTSKNMFMAYQVFGSEGVRLPIGYKVEVGAEIVLYGPIVNYKNNTPETQGKGAAHIVTINGKPTGGEEPTPSGNHGTAEAPLTVAQAIALIDAESTISEAYVKGKISQIDSYSDQYKSITYWISDDGTTKTQLQVYSGKGLNGADFTSKDDIKVGQTVTIKGALKKYNTTYEFDKTSSIISIDGDGGGSDTGTAKGSGTKADPFNIAAAIAKCQEVGETASTEKYYIKGIVVKGGTASGGYGNVTFDMGDTKESTDLFKAYQVAGTDGAKLADGYEVKAGDEVVIYGPVVNYKGNTPETTGKSAAQIVTINGKSTEDNAGGGNSGEAVTSLANGGFETWADGIPTGWKSASTASSATLEQSTDAHGGSYACIVKGDEGSNKRLGSQEITLAAGTYTFSFWVKATTSDAAQVRPGYVPVDDSNKAGNYAYGDYKDITTTWQQVSYEFTLNAETKVCLVVMNPKKSKYSSGKDVLIDDATLTKK